MNIAHDLLIAADAWPASCAIYFNDEVVSFGLLAQRAGRWQSGLAELGVKAGDRVAMLLPNGPEFAYGYYATVALGAVFVPLDPVLKADELAEILDDLQPVLLVAAGNLEGDASGVRSDQRLDRVLVSLLQNGHGDSLDRHDRR